jgi:hypothetical protein
MPTFNLDHTKNTLAAIHKAKGLTSQQHKDIVAAIEAIAEKPEHARDLEALERDVDTHLALINHRELKYADKTLTTPNAQLTIPEAIFPAYDIRTRRTRMLEKDGVALSFRHGPQQKSLALIAEDPKGRIVPLISWASPKKALFNPQGITPSKGGKLPILETSDIRHSPLTNAMSPMLRELASTLQQRIAPVSYNPQLEPELASFKPLLYCKNEGVELMTTYTKDVFEGALVVPLDRPDQAVHAQLNKIDRKILNHISNGLRKGPTAKTVQKAITELLGDTPITTTPDMKQALQTLLSGLDKHDHTFTDTWLTKTANMIMQQPPEHHAVMLLNAFNYSPLAFNAEAKADKRWHKPFKDTQKSTNNTPSAQPKKETTQPPHKNATQGEGQTTPPHGAPIPTGATTPAPTQALKEIFEQYRDNLSSEQLSHKLIEVLSGGRLLPLTHEDIQSIHHTVKTMQDRPHRVHNGLNWLCDIADEAKSRATEPEQVPRHTQDQTPRPRR